MKKPKSIWRLDTRFNKEAKDKQPNDLQTMGLEHIDSAAKRANEIDKALEESGYSVVRNGENPYFHHKVSGRNYDPKAGKFFNRSLESPNVLRDPAKPEISPEVQQMIDDMVYQERLGELAFASDMFGRDFYHDADMRAGKKKPNE